MKNNLKRGPIPLNKSRHIKIDAYHAENFFPWKNNFEDLKRQHN